jgi:hypothetical protein
MDDPPSLQVLYFGKEPLNAEATRLALPVLWAGAIVELSPAPVYDGSGPAFVQAGVVTFGPHLIKLLHSLEPMPYGPVETCVGPALIPPPMKVDAKLHGSHSLLYYSGKDTDPMEQFVALCTVAGALARFDAIVVLNEEARTACPALDLIPDDGEDVLATYRNLPIPYLLGGFVRMNVGDDPKPWVRTFANQRLNLPNLATQLRSHEETGSTFELFAGLLGYLRKMNETFTAGDTLDLGDRKLSLREPVDAEWWLDSDGPLLVVES